MTLVGALVFHCVDVLTGLTMAQILRPGHPVLFGGAPATFHMKAASSPMAAIEAQRLNVAYVAIAKSLGLPSQEKLPDLPPPPRQANMRLQRVLRMFAAIVISGRDQVPALQDNHAVGNR